MERHPRKTAALVVPEPVAILLGQWRQLAAAVGPDELDVDRVRDVEGTMGTGLPDIMLAVICARVPTLDEGIGLQLGRIAQHSANARARRVRGDFVACAAESDGAVFYGFLKKSADTHLAIFRPARGRVESRLYLDWLSERAAEDGVNRHTAAPAFRPRLRLDPLPEGDGQRVRHAKWGVGRVLAEHGEGPTRKVKAEFPSLGLKVVQARFLEFL